MSATAVGRALVEGLGAVDSKLVRPELRASMEEIVAKVARGEAQKSAVVREGLATFQAQFERLKKSMHMMVPHFGELGVLRLEKEGEGGQDELIRLELLAQAGKQSAAEWKRARDSMCMRLRARGLARGHIYVHAASSPQTCPWPYICACRFEPWTLAHRTPGRQTLRPAGLISLRSRPL